MLLQSQWALLVPLPLVVLLRLLPPWALLLQQPRWALLLQQSRPAFLLQQPRPALLLQQPHRALLLRRPHRALLLPNRVRNHFLQKCFRYLFLDRRRLLPRQKPFLGARRQRQPVAHFEGRGGRQPVNRWLRYHQRDRSRRHQKECPLGHQWGGRSPYHIRNRLYPGCDAIRRPGHFPVRAAALHRKQWLPRVR